MRAAIGNDYDNDGLLGHHGHVVVVGRRPTEMRDGIILGGTVEAIPPEICAGACQKTVRAALPAISFGSKSKVFVSFWVRIQKVFVSLINKVFVSFGIEKVFVSFGSKIQNPTFSHQKQQNTTMKMKTTTTMTAAKAPTTLALLLLLLVSTTLPHGIDAGFFKKKHRRQKAGTHYNAHDAVHVVVNKVG